LLEGLEVKEILYSNTLSNKDFRTDSDFWTKEPFINSNLSYRKVGTLLNKAQYGLSISMNEDGKGYPIYRMNEIHNMLCDLEADKCADISHDDFLRFKLEDKDVLFNRTNSYEWVGRTGIYRNTNKANCTFASYLVKLLPDEKVILPEYLTTYLNTRYGIKDIKRRSRQSINQTNVNPEEVKEILIPILSLKFQENIRNCFDRAYINRVKTNQLYSTAESILLEPLGLKNFSPSIEPFNIKSFKGSFCESGRLDAEYYQVKYEGYDQLVKNYDGGWMSLGEICELQDKNFIPVDEQEYQYIELADIGEGGIINGCTLAVGKELPSRARRVVHSGDVIISSIEGSLGSCAIVSKEYHSSLCSTGFYVINSKRINPETLLVLFKSEPMQNILKRSCSGTILTAINKNEFLQIPLPVIKMDVQQKIAGIIGESFKQKQKSEQLLETAKHAVEMAIEEGEDRAMEWMDSQLLII